MANLQAWRSDATAWAKGLKMKEAAADLATLPVLFPAWLAGRIWYFTKYVVGLAVVGFRRGARMQ